jgi:hypothetical protein
MVTPELLTAVLKTMETRMDYPDLIEARVIEVCFNQASEKYVYLDIEHAEHQYRSMMDAWTLFLESGSPKIHHLIVGDGHGKVSVSLAGIMAVKFGIISNDTMDYAVRQMVYQQRQNMTMEDQVKVALKQRTGF